MSDAPRIVVTRPAGQVQGLCDALAAAGFQASPIPVMEILPAAQPAQILSDLGDIAQIDLLIFVSTNAVRFALDYLPTGRLDEIVRGTVAAVGPSTARALEDAGLPCQVVPRSGFSSEALLDEPALQSVADIKVVIFRGNGGRALLGDRLTQRGAEVHYCEVYRRQIPQGSAAALQARLDTGGVDIITATSVETLVNIEQMAGARRSQLLHDVKIVTASERVLKKALELGYTGEVLLADAPDDAALVKAIVEWQRTARAQLNAPEKKSMATDSNGKDNKTNDAQDASSPLDDDAAPESIHSDQPNEPAASSEAELAAPPSEPIVVTATPAKSGRGIALLALLLALGAGALSAYSAWKSQNPVIAEVEDPSIALDAVADSLRSDVQSDIKSLRDEATRSAASLRSDVQSKLDGIDLSELDTVAGEINTIGDEQSKLSRRLSGQERSIKTVTDRLAGMESNMNAMQGVSDSVRSTWVRAEAEYFLQTANSRLQLAGDVDSALEALRAADERIGALGDPGLIRVRAKITEEILAVEGVPRPDVEGMALTLIGMVERVPKLPLALDDVPTKYENGPKKNIDDKSGWERARASMANAFSDIVRITPADGSSSITVLPPEDAFFIVRNLELHLNVARLALMQKESDNFKASVKSARDWLALYYDTDDPGVQTMLTRLDTLEQTAIDPSIPDISASLRMLRTLVATSNTTP